MRVSQQALYQRRRRRIQRAVALERPDRTPVVLEYSGFAALACGVPLADFVTSPARATELMRQAYDLVGGGDAVNYGSFWPYSLCRGFGARVRVPGVDLPADEMWQVDEQELVGPEEYERILERGWPAFFARLLQERLQYRPPPAPPKGFDIQKIWAARGVPVLCGGQVTTPLELLCGSRSLDQFARDLHRRPEVVAAVMEEIAPHLAAKACRRARAQGLPGVWLGGWRSAPSLLSRPMWERFVWPHFRRLALEIIDYGLVCILHLDADWTRELERFLELPRGRCIMSLDGATDIWRAKQILGGHMCLMGDVPPHLLCLGSPKEVHAYCRRLIQGLGPEGFILQSGCDIPANAPLNNVRAMVAAAEG